MLSLAAAIVAAVSAAPIMLADASSPGPGTNARSPATGAAAAAPASAARATIHPTLELRLAQSPRPVAAWVYFTDKGLFTQEQKAEALAVVAASYDARATARRAQRRTLPGHFDENDVAAPQHYIDAVTATGAWLRTTSRWLNAVSVRLDRAQAEAIAALPFVRAIEPVRSGRRIPAPGAAPADGLPTADFYGWSRDQIALINLIRLHEQGFTARDVVIGVLDTGFKRTHRAFNHAEHPLRVRAEWDFINNDADTGPQFGDPEGQYWHGTFILGILGAYAPGELVGAAYDAEYILCKTEDVSGETPVEEDYYVAGLEFIESNGGDVATSSLGYIDWYTQEQLDGLTAVTSRGVNIATANGVFCLTAAGNMGNDGDPRTSHLMAPGDALRVVTVGAVSREGSIAGFSSDGPSADGRVKPEVCAVGEDIASVDPDDDGRYGWASGTSTATPLAAGAVACLLQAHPEWNVAQMRAYLFTACDYYRQSGGGFDPLYARGYGAINAFLSHAADCNASGLPDADDIAEGRSRDLNGNLVPDECEPCVADLDHDGRIGQADLATLLAYFGCSGGNCGGDVDDDGRTDITDLAILLAVYGQACP